MISSLPRIVVVLWLLIHAVAVAQQPRYGKLQIKGSFLERLVLNDENHQPYDFPAPGAVVSVPVGRYRIAMVELKGGYFLDLHQKQGLVHHRSRGTSLRQTRWRH